MVRAPVEFDAPERAMSSSIRVAVTLTGDVNFCQLRRAFEIEWLVSRQAAGWEKSRTIAAADVAGALITIVARLPAAVDCERVIPPEATSTIVPNVVPVSPEVFPSVETPRP